MKLYWEVSARFNGDTYQRIWKRPLANYAKRSKRIPLNPSFPLVHPLPFSCFLPTSHRAHPSAHHARRRQIRRYRLTGSYALILTVSSPDAPRPGLREPDRMWNRSPLGHESRSRKSPPMRSQALQETPPRPRSLVPRPSTRSPRMLRMTSDVPPSIDCARMRRNNVRGLSPKSPASRGRDIG